MTLSPPWVLHCVDGRPESILPAGRPGTVARVSGMDEREAREIVKRANAAHCGSAIRKMRAAADEVRRLVDSFLRPDAFTVGNKRSYDKALGEWASKLGARPAGDPEFPDGYGGGWVWRSAAAADAWLSSSDPPPPQDGPVPEFRRMGGHRVSFEGRRPVVCAVYGLCLPSGWDSDVSQDQMAGPLYSEFDPFRPYALLRDALIVPLP